MPDTPSETEDLLFTGQETTRERPAEMPRNSCFITRSDGIFIDPGKLPDPATLQRQIDRIFSANAFFSGLDYRVFTRLMYECGPPLTATPGCEPLVRMADAITPFPPQRQTLYRAVKIEDGEAIYSFEPVYLDSEADADGFSQPLSATLDRDEFIADMWKKGVRFGLDIDAIQHMIDSGEHGRIVIAHPLPMTPGKDAGLQELVEEIHRDDSPKQLASGRLDLRQFKNRFPQIRKNVRLMKKVPRVIGLPGYDIAGKPVDPPLPKDLDLASLVGPGVTHERVADGEFITTTQDGFLVFDTRNNQISISDKMINHEGVSGRSTGDLHLSGAEFEEFGEVQANRIVEGNTITLHADVFGNLISRGGRITLDKNLIGGTATNHEGDILIKGIASGATIQALDGNISIKRAESCTIAGKRVSIEQATNCDIIAETLTIKQAEGCSVAARDIGIETAAPRKQTEMRVFVLVPDLTGINASMAEIRQKLGEHNQLLEEKRHQAEAIPSRPDVKNYIALATRIRNKEITMTAEQVADFQKLQRTVAPLLQQAAQLNTDIEQIRKRREPLDAQLAELQLQKETIQADIRCSIRLVNGDTLVRGMTFDPSAEPLYCLPPKDLKGRLRSQSSSGKPLFAGTSGRFDWQLQKETSSS